MLYRLSPAVCLLARVQATFLAYHNLANMTGRNSILAALALCAVLSAATCSAKLVTVSLKKGPLAPMASLRPSAMQHSLQQANGGADVPMKNFLDAQVCCSFRGLLTFCACNIAAPAPRICVSKR